MTIARIVLFCIAVMNSVLLINKPLLWTSFDVIRKLKSHFRSTHPSLRIGHAGTLDPMATGLLIVCTGSMTKKIHVFQQMEKEYTGTMVLGSVTDSFDLETSVQPVSPVDHITESQIIKASEKFRGKLLQTPPVFSAKKYGGVRAYEKARKKENIVLQPSEIIIHEFEITGMSLPKVNFRIVCSKGTYIRSVANDFGKDLGCGAYLSSLCRTRIGEYYLEDSIDLEKSGWESQLLAVATTV